MVLRRRHPMFKGRHFDQEIIILCVRWYVTYKLSYRDLVRHDARARHLGGAEHDLQVGPTVRARVREALESILSTGRLFVACGRDLHPGQGPVVLPISSGRQAGPHRRLPLAPRPRHRRRPGVLPEGLRLASEPSVAKGDPRWSLAKPSCSQAASPRASSMAARACSNLPVPQQHRRARSPSDQATLCDDAAGSSRSPQLRPPWRGLSSRTAYASGSLSVSPRIDVRHSSFVASGTRRSWSDQRARTQTVLIPIRRL